MENANITIILPCQNEEEGLAFCLEQIKSTLPGAQVIVSDSSQDASPAIAEKYGAMVVKHDQDGYGRAYLEAFPKATGEYIMMADADGTYDLTQIPRFITELKKGTDLVLGNRFAGNIYPGAMPFLNRYLGNPLLSGILRLFFSTKVHDSHTGMRAIKKSALEKLRLRTTGMEFASEMIIKALKQHFTISEIPIDYHVRKGVSKLKPFSDAWKHIRFMLLYSPLFLFFIPGAILFGLGIISMGLNPMLSSSALIIIGYQLIIFALFAKSYAINHLGEPAEEMDVLYRHITIEKASGAGFLFILAGLIGIKNNIVGLTLIIFGCQTIFSSFMLSILAIKEK